MAQASSERPGPGTATGRVWEIADALSRSTGGRARRAEVISAYVNEGGNPNTAHTQFQKWRTAYEESRKGSVRGPSLLRVQVKEGGRIALPAELRTTLGIAEGDTLLVEVVDGQLTLLTRAAALRRAQELVRQYIPDAKNVVDDFIAERRREAEREGAAE